MTNNQSPFDPVESIHTHGTFLRNLKEFPWFVRAPFAVFFLILPSSLTYLILIESLIAKFDAGGVLLFFGLSIILLPMLLAGVVILIGKRD